VGQGLSPVACGRSASYKERGKGPVPITRVGGRILDRRATDRCHQEGRKLSLLKLAAILALAVAVAVAVSRSTKPKPTEVARAEADALPDGSESAKLTGPNLELEVKYLKIQVNALRRENDEFRAREGR
jgi:hypothetical protein